jgi:eukaryotic-like serine/threonine-protein kinase
VTNLQDRLSAALGAGYEVVGRLGSGGMSHVFLAHDLRHGRRVAVKVMRPEMTASIGAERFKREIEIVARLHHPHILPLYDSGQGAGLLYYTMPFVEGESLRERLHRNGRFGVDEAVRIAVEIADALGFAHAASVIHRDIKPANILLVHDHAVVADFGVARAVTAERDALTDDGETGTITEVGLALGTPLYMSPEQVLGAHEVDARADLYSLGTVLYEMLAGAPPYSAPTAQAIIARKCTEPPPRISALRDDVPPGIEEALLRVMTANPADRYETAEEFSHALTAPSQGSMAAISAGPWITVGGTTRRTESSTTKSVAVLPFVSLSADAEDEFLADGLSEELILALSRGRRLRVVGRTTAFTMKGKSHDAREIGARWNVGAILEGSLRRAGQRLRIASRLVDARSGYEMWSDRYDRTLDDMFEMQDEIARKIVDAMQATLLGDAPLVSRPTEDVEAYEWYLKGRYHWNSRTESGLRQSIECLTRALDRDRGFAQASAALAQSLATMAIYGAAAPEEVIPAARTAAEDALARDATLADALSALACVKAIYDWDWDGAHADFTRALTLDPQSPGARHWFAVHALAPRGRFELARAQLRAAQSLDPQSPVIAASLGLVSYLERDYANAIESCRAALNLEPHFALAHFFLARALSAAGDHMAAGTSLARALGLSGGSPEIIAEHGVARAMAGDTETARSSLATLSRMAGERWISPVLTAQLHLALGDRASALADLERAREARASDLIWIGTRPVFDPLRGDERFAAIVRAVGL